MMSMIQKRWHASFKSNTMQSMRLRSKSMIKMMTTKMMMFHRITTETVAAPTKARREGEGATVIRMTTIVFLVWISISGTMKISRCSRKCSAASTSVAS